MIGTIFNLIKLGGKKAKENAKNGNGTAPVRFHILFNHLNRVNLGKEHYRKGCIQPPFGRKQSIPKTW